MKSKKHFPNGFTDWMETHCEVYEHLYTTIDEPGSIANTAMVSGGRGRVYEVSEELTDEFEKRVSGEEWYNGDYLESVQTFLEQAEIGHRTINEP